MTSPSSVMVVAVALLDKLSPGFIASVPDKASQSNCGSLTDFVMVLTVPADQEGKGSIVNSAGRG
jgi:hypothetical protein